MEASNPEINGSQEGNTAAPRRSRNEMVAEAFRTGRMPEDWIEEGEDERDEQDDGEESEEGHHYEHDGDDRYPLHEPESHRLSATGLKSIGCLVGAIALIAMACLTAVPSLALVALWLGVLALAGGSLYLLNRLVEEHERDFTVLLPGIGAAAGAAVILIVGLAGDKDRGGFFAFTIFAAIAALCYAVFYNRKHFGTGNALAVTVVEAVFTPIAIALALAYYFRHDLIRQVAPGAMPPGRPSANGRGRTIPEIGSVSQNHMNFVVYDDRGNMISQFTFNGDLIGYTSRGFQIQSGQTVFSFDAFCRPIHQRIV